MTLIEKKKKPMTEMDNPNMMQREVDKYDFFDFIKDNYKGIKILSVMGKNVSFDTEERIKSIAIRPDAITFYLVGGSAVSIGFHSESGFYKKAGNNVQDPILWQIINGDGSGCSFKV